ncbi:MAG: TrbI/VirB10 family protein [Terriglobales bacterium]
MSVLALALCVPAGLLAQGGNIVQPAQSQTQNQQLQQIREQGYNAGFHAGVTDYRSHAPYSFQSQPVYNTGTLGYSANSGIAEQDYKINFQSGFERGYDDGYYGRTSDNGAQRQRSYSSEPSAHVAAANPAQNAAASSQSTLPAGTALQLKLNNTLSTRSSNPGDSFTATVTQPVAGPDGRTIVIPVGSTVEGQVQSVVRSGSISGTARIQLAFDQLRLPHGQSYPLKAELSNINQKGQGVGTAITGTPSTTNEGGVTQSKTRRTVGTAAAGGAVGALLGAIAGGGKGAGIGGLVGAGLGVVLAGHNGALDLPSGTPITITLSQPVQLGGH